MQVFINWVIAAAAIMVSAYVLPGVQVASIWTALVLAIVLGLINACVRPVLIVLTLPVTIITLGLFTLVINALMVLLASWIVKGFEVQNFWWALLFSVVLSLVDMFFKNARR